MINKSTFLSILLVCSIVPVWSVAPDPALGVDWAEPYRPHLRGAHRYTLAAPARRQEMNAEQRGLLILVNYADSAFRAENTRAAFDSLANAEDYRYNGATGSTRAYFIDQSNGLYQPHFDVVGPYTLPHGYAWYGKDSLSRGDDRYPADLVIDACKAAYQDGIDFSPYDADGDSIVDFVFVLYAGVGQSDGGGANTIWPHEWELTAALALGYTGQTEYYVDYDFEADSIIYAHLPQFGGFTIDQYACSNELKYNPRQRCGIGTMCHEFSHVLGLKDYYITATSHIDGHRQPDATTPGNWSIMGHGNYLNNGNTPPNYSVYDKFALGWITPQVLQQDEEISLPADGQTYTMVTRNQQMPTEGVWTTDTVYYIENRQYTGWDTYLPGHGMLVWRIIYDSLAWDQGWVNNDIPRCFVIGADGQYAYTASDNNAHDREGTTFPGSNHVQTFAPWENQTLSSIREENGVIVFSFHGLPSGWQEVVGDETENLWYDLCGRQVNPSSYTGIAISKKGKKRLFIK